MFDSSGSKKHECLLDFLEMDGSPKVIHFGVNNDGEILIHVKCSDCIYFCDGKGTFKSSVTLDKNPGYNSGDCISLQCVTDQNELVMCTSKNVLVYTKEGNLERTITAEYVDGNVTYNNQTSKIEILGRRLRELGQRPRSQFLVTRKTMRLNDCMYQ